MPLYVCSAGHLVRADNSQVSIDSICGKCKAAARLRAVKAHAASLPHGMRARYAAGCRCEECRKANSAYENARQKARRQGGWNGLVDAAKARAHLRKLSRIGVGKNAVAAASDVARVILQDVRAGRRTKIRASTERRILAVTSAMASDRALVSAARTWRLLDELVDEGFTKTQLAAKLGYSRPALQIGRRQVTVRNAARVERLHRELTT